jgi:hypothetical protein
MKRLHAAAFSPSNALIAAIAAVVIAALWALPG